MALTTNAHLDTYLSGILKGYVPKGYIAEQLLTPVRTAQYQGKIPGIGKDHLRIISPRVNDRGEYNYLETNTYTSTSYDIEDYGVETVITDKMFRDYTKPIDARRDTSMKLTTMMFSSKEYSVLTAATTAGSYAATNKVTLTSTDKLSDYTNSDPAGVFNTAAHAVRASCGMPPDTATMDWKTFNTLVKHPKITAKSQYVTDVAGGVSTAALADFIGVSRILISDTMYNSAVKGQTDAFAPIMGKFILLSVSPMAGEIYQTSFGYNVTLDNIPNKQVSRMKIEGRDGMNEKLWISDRYDTVLDTTAGYLITDAIA